ncbi:hypothetical protein G5S34_04345 [Herbaspirillum frisingense]|uniref:hypothetical protein n=1 Tax=Herbaspirillum frisingense TaxID=92645 RepID=UPI001600040A|nr:hypothetical protein [Herbaspirillum frisingense]QNB06078.1 hypothetical protein G5S34_04345 [Herbaspirillum frisingense]
MIRSADDFLAADSRDVELRSEVSKIFNRLCEAPMMPSSHGKREGVEESIIAAARRSAEEYSTNPRKSPAISIMDVILAANRGYERQVRRHVEAMRGKFPSLTLKALQKKANEAKDYLAFQDVWGHKDEKKFTLLKDMLDCIVPWLGKKDSVENDYAVMSKWAQDTSLSNFDSDEIGQLGNVGVATFQHLRMTFGINAIKPDQRVKEVLEYEFGWKVSSDRAIVVVEKIAEVLDESPLLVDQVFVKYGSGHYPKASKSPCSA